VGNKPKAPQNERRAKVEALKKQQKAAERKKTVAVVGGATLVAAALIAVPTVKIISDQRENNVSIATLGAPQDLAGCDEVKKDSSEGSGDHVEGPVKYETIPPSSGSHRGTWVTVNNRGFYSEDDVPELEQLVHNLEHGYTVVWYEPSISESDRDVLERLAKRLRGDSQYKKFIAVPWDTARGGFPNGKPIAMSHWGKNDSYRMYCSKVSGPAIQRFMNEYPASDSPEPNTP
jgi:hypothetical protein